MKINGNMTLFELQEYCEKHSCVCDIAGLDKCEYYLEDFLCPFNKRHPSIWPLYKPKTYMEDALEKFPNISRSDFDNLPKVCVATLYGKKHKPEVCDSYPCENCWNTVMPEEE